MKPLPTLSLLCASLFSCAAFSADVTPDVIMKFESLKKPVLSANGSAFAVEVSPDRGDSHGMVKRLDGDQSFTVAGGSKPLISNDGRFAAFAIEPALLEQEKASPKARKKLKAGLALLDTESGKETRYDKVKEFAFNEAGTHLAIWYEAGEEDDGDKQDEGEANDKNSQAKAKESESKLKVDKYDKGRTLEVVNLKAGSSEKLAHVTAYYFDKAGRSLVAAQNDIANNLHRVQRLDLNSGELEVVAGFVDQQIGAVSTSEDGKYVAFTYGKASEAPWGREYHLALHQSGSDKLHRVANTKEWTLNRYSELTFSEDSKRLFFGRVPEVSQQLELPKVAKADDLYDADLIAGQRELRVWHGDDPRIKPNEVKQYKKALKHTYLAVLHLGSKQVVQLADQAVPDIELGQQQRFMLASTDVPYLKMITWAGFYRDYYLVDLNTGRKQAFLIQQPVGQEPSLSPNERFVAYYQQGNIFLYQIAQDSRVKLTKDFKTPFADEDHDYPSVAPGYGLGPWVEDGSAFLAYDKYDIWQFNTDSFDAFRLTAAKGRKAQIQYRVTGLLEKADKPVRLQPDQSLLLHGYNERTKGDGFYTAKVGVSGVKPLMQGDYKLKLLARAEESDKILFSKERYDLYPDLYASDLQSPELASRQTRLDDQKGELDWGKAELVHWTNGDGKPLDGVLIKPSNYVAGKRYPVLVYFYRFMSDRLHAFPDMKLNHRPNFAWYADNGYAIFLPDIRFEVGYPGASSVQALTSGVQKLVDMGIADANAVGIQGHSWGGYQTAFAVTQTSIFKAAVTGAPVSNMTSAYSGIRHGTGLARQFQYETGQSRIGESLFKAPQKYIENSPVFYVERIKTPMMIMFGDKDDAVPWEQGVELYLAMRRAGKDVVFLQYQDEPHHLKKYPNKLDYSLRMMQYFDHYLKGKPAPKWLSEGEAYQEYKKAG
ncbi:prolyl oligopeptidase family serine peptidase [Shewanella sp. Isolate7]|uniref:alpha/beta hydrolase family protein n=1 Tax=Shewanella sp. Isolate7 TaxID=2908528 RepID=UPI001EFDE19F|nr:prolyl oligopeptidase family serine peptidase [Shewanella sp. Isolate7]MCG9722458.1 prolyl oligopeptidase family serine peptidase [Shewanella sp. Isolate7]